MPELHDSKHEKYAGPSKPALALLEGRVYGFFGGLIGLVGGAALSGNVIKEESKLVQESSAFLKGWGVPLKGRALLMAAGALAGSAVMHRIGNIIGIAVGARKAGDPEAQFDRTQNRIAQLEEKVEALAATSPSASFTAREDARASTPETTLVR